MGLELQKFGQQAGAGAIGGNNAQKAKGAEASKANAKQNANKAQNPQKTQNAGKVGAQNGKIETGANASAGSGQGISGAAFGNATTGNAAGIQGAGKAGNTQIAANTANGANGGEKGYEQGVKDACKQMGVDPNQLKGGKFNAMC